MVDSSMSINFDAGVTGNTYRVIWGTGSMGFNEMILLAMFDWDS